MRRRCPAPKTGELASSGGAFTVYFSDPWGYRSEDPCYLVRQGTGRCCVLRDFAPRWVRFVCRYREVRGSWLLVRGPPFRGPETWFGGLSTASWLGRTALSA